MTDPRCPACREKVSARAEYCMHCGADFEAPVDASADGDGEVTVSVGRESDHAGHAVEADDVGRTAIAAESPDRRPTTVADVVLATLLAPLIALFEASEDLRTTITVAVPAVVFVFVYRAVPDVDRSPKTSLALLVSVPLMVYIGRQIRGRDVLAATGLGTGFVLVGTRLTEAAGIGLAEGGARAAAKLSATAPSILLGCGLLALGLWLRD